MSKLTLLETEIAIKYIKDNFEQQLAKSLDLTRVSAPLFVFPETGLNDNLNGYERAVKFDVKDLGKEVEIVQSLAKWKRNALYRYGFNKGKGLYTDMNAIRRDETLDNTHSVYVDQWDWEKIIDESERKTSYLKKTVKKIYSVLKKVSDKIEKTYGIKHDLPKDIYFITTKELEKLYPEKSRKERENLITKKYGAVFLMQIGWNLSDKAPHDGRAADYDDWKLNGDLLVWFEPLDMALELSSMGIRVDKSSLVKQIKKKKEEDKLENQYCKDILADKLPLTIGGGIGQSRLCMYLLNKSHVGEVQASVWSESTLNENAEKGIIIL